MLAKMQGFFACDYFIVNDPNQVCDYSIVNDPKAFDKMESII